MQLAKRYFDVFYIYSFDGNHRLKLNWNKGKNMSDKINDFLAEPLPRKVLFFDSMLTPSLIRPLYWLALIVLAWCSIGHFFSNGFFGMFEAAVIFVVGAIVLRVIAELAMLLFKINENLASIAQNTGSETDQTVIETDSE